MSGGAVFGNWLFGSTFIIVLFMVFYLGFKKEGYVCILVPSRHNLGSPPPPLPFFPELSLSDFSWKETIGSFFLLFFFQNVCMNIYIIINTMHTVKRGCNITLQKVFYLPGRHSANQSSRRLPMR